MVKKTHAIMWVPRGLLVMLSAEASLRGPIIVKIENSRKQPQRLWLLCVKKSRAQTFSLEEQEVARKPCKRYPRQSNNWNETCSGPSDGSGSYTVKRFLTMLDAMFKVVDEALYLNSVGMCLFVALGLGKLWNCSSATLLKF